MWRIFSAKRLGTRELSTVRQWRRRAARWICAVGIVFGMGVAWAEEQPIEGKGGLSVEADANVGYVKRRDNVVVRLKERIQIDTVGDADCQLVLTMPAEAYTQLKVGTPNTAALLRRIGWGQSWGELENVQGRFEDNSSALIIQYKQRGFARSDGEYQWSVALPESVKLDLVSKQDRKLVFTAIQESDLGLINATSEIEIPENGQRLDLSGNPERVLYATRPGAFKGDRFEAEFQLETKPQIMSSIAKSYTNPKFSHLWVARSVFRNKSERPLQDYRVRFRLVGQSSWSGWQRNRLVLPGQTAVDAYFPLMDLDKLAGHHSSTTVALETEYEYTRPDGRLVQENEIRRIRLLGRNQVIFSSLANEQAVGFHDRFNYGPLILASFVHYNDPVVQQVAGAISGMAGGVSASSNDAEAERFLEALYNFMATNKIAYQTPPGGIFEGKFGQHVKYPRDVLQNRAGTCIDLAIFYASVGQAVGLRPVMFLVPGHCYPAFHLPSGNLLAIETTQVGAGSFQKARESGKNNLLTAFQNGRYFMVDVQEMHDHGVDALDLPAVPNDYLVSLGYSFQSPPIQTTLRKPPVKVSPSAIHGQPSASEAQTEAYPETITPNANTPSKTDTPQPNDSIQKTDELQAVVDILNDLPFAVKYESQWGDDEWESAELPPGELMTHWYPYNPKAPGETPTFTVRFDADTSDKVVYRVFSLKWTVVRDPQKDPGGQFKFKLDAKANSSTQVQLYDAN